MENNESVNNEEINEVIKKKKSKLVPLIIIILVLVVAGISAFMYMGNQKEIEAFNSYKDDFTVTLSLMKSEADKCVDISNQYASTWHDAIYSDDDIDFNMALALLYSKLEDEGTLADIEASKDTIDEKISSLQSTHVDFENAYLDLLDFYEVYAAIYKTASDPTGSYQSYSEEVNELESDLEKNYSRIKIRIPQEMK
jgi:type II secretory pathway pseudopilin PulG